MSTHAPTPSGSAPGSAHPAGIAAVVASLLPVAAETQPHGLVVQSGSASAVAVGSQTRITASDNAVLQWSSFNVPAGTTTSFLQPSATSVVWNRILDRDPSRIHGSITANGVVVLMNAAGFHFGPDAFVSAAGLVVSTAAVTPIESGTGLQWQFNGAPPGAAIVNYGRLETGPGGSAFLIADRIENHGTITAPGGTIGLAAGREVLLSERPDGRGLSAEVTLPSGSIDQSGHLTADAGQIALHARVVNQAGVLQASGARERGGIVELLASEELRLGATSEIRTDAPQESGADGGRITLRSERSLTDTEGSTLSATGAHGGTVAISAPELPAIHSRIDGSGGNGGNGGRLVIDPVDIILGNAGSGSAGGGIVGAETPPSTLNLDVNAAFTGFSRIVLQATRNITLQAGVTWDLAASTGLSEPGSLLQLEAGNNITLANGASILAGENWSISLQAGRDFATQDAVRPGTGSVLLNGSATVQAANGRIDVRAGQNVTVGGGAIRSTAGGAISAEAVAGSIQTGTRPNGFVFLPSGYSPDAQVGGISTLAGGDVSLTAGQDIVSFLPLPGGIQSNGGSGALGAEPGNVTVTAGRDVAGHFIVGNGLGAIEAGRNAGTASRLLALSLVRGGWDVSAGHDILLQEIRNPNGVFNNLGASTAPNRHRFDYAPDAFARLTANHSVQLRGTALPRYNDVFSQGLPPIYPGRLDIAAGAGGVELANDVLLFPSPQGHLAITTTDGGSLTGTRAEGLTQLVMSDSGRTQYRAFGDFGAADHAATPLHLDHPDPVRLDLAGDMRGILLATPKRAEIRVAGDAINTRLELQHLDSQDVSLFEVAGDIRNRNEFTRVPLDAAPDFSSFELGLIYPPPSGGLAGIESRFSYDAANRILTFRGRMTGEQLQFLRQTPTVVLDASGAPVLQPSGEPLTRLVPTLPVAVLERLYAESQDVPLNPDTGYRIGGPGRFELRAHHLDLGATAGIVSQGPRANPALASLATRGADIEIDLAGDLDMFSTRIATLAGGTIRLDVEGDLNAGSRTFIATDSAARGIYTVTPDGNIDVAARGDIHINGSRIAAYDGGHVIVRSLEGSIDAGTESGGAATVEKIQVDPDSRRVLSYTATIPGSGILATTFPPSLDPAFPPSTAPVGDILVETPRGDIRASAGGIVQIPLNRAASSPSAGTVTLRAGTRAPDGSVVHRGDIDASGSGVIGTTVKLEASGSIRGLVFARQDIDVSAVQNVNVTALAQGNVNVASGGNVSGTIIGVGSVNASGGGTVDAALLSQNVTTSGDAAGAQVGFAQGTAAASATQGAQASESEPADAKATRADEDEQSRKQRTPAPRLTRTTGRVTVILPKP